MKKENLNPILKWARQVERLDEIVASQFDYALHGPKAKLVKTGEYFDIYFNINIIPKYLQPLFIQRINSNIMLFGEISTDIRKSKRYFHYKNMKLNGAIVSAELLKNLDF